MSRATVVFSCLGHLYVHLCTAFYFVIVLALERAWRLPYSDLIELWTLGSIVIGVAALPAGVLSDRVGATRMMVIFFTGMGASSVAAGLVHTPTGMMLALTGIGLFGAIYHPVGVPWLVRNAGATSGNALGFNGIFGALGNAAAGLTAGALIDLLGWRSAFIVPGVVCVVTGLALAACARAGLVDDRETVVEARAPSTRADMRRVFAVLLVTMFLGGVIYQCTQTSLPKLLEERERMLIGSGAFGIGVLVAVVYTAAGLMQVVGGRLADRFPLKLVYVAALAMEVPLLWLAASSSGTLLVVVATAMVMANAAAIPAETMLLARYAPRHRHGLVFGLRFVVSFAAAPIAVQIVAFFTGHADGLYRVYAFLAVAGFLAAAAALLLPRARPAVALAPSGGD